MKKNIISRKKAEAIYDTVVDVLGACVLMGFFYYFILAWFRII